MRAAEFIPIGTCPVRPTSSPGTTVLSSSTTRLQCFWTESKLTPSSPESESSASTVTLLQSVGIEEGRRKKGRKEDRIEWEGAKKGVSMRTTA